MDIASTIAPPHSLLCVAAPLDHAGYDVKIIDQRVNANWKQDLLNELETQPIYVGITCMVGTSVKFAIEIARIVREFSHIPIVWGGPLPTIIPQQFIDSGLADYVLMREVDETIVDLTQKIANKTCERIVDSPLPDMEKLLPEPYHLVDVESYIHKDMYVKNGVRTMDISQSSRRCPMNCGFCASRAIGLGKWRAMSADKAIDMITNVVKKYNLTGFWLRDDEFYINRERASKITEAMIPLNMRWYTSGTRADIFVKTPEEQIALYKRAGAHTLKFGAESGNQTILNLMNKGITVEQTLEANRLCKKHGITPAFALMCGFPTETWEQVNDTIRLAKQLRKENPNAQFETMAIYTAHPGTPMLSLAEAHGLVLPTKLEEWATWNADEYDLEGKRTPWLTKSERIALGNLCYLSMLSNAVPNVLDALENPTEAKLLKILYAIPHEYFKWSFFNAHYKFHPEMLLIRAARKFVFYSGHKVLK
jgi:radical SAM superfamily enzyme YgiQ (UPF0313 family)